MIVMLDTSHNLAKCSRELGLPVEELFTPLTNFSCKQPGAKFCIDNGAFSRFDADAFLRLLEKHKDRQELCRFVALPDVVASARRTLECFNHWTHKLIGWKRALVAQDGLENLDIPWAQIDAVFIGGSTEWKLSKSAADVVRAAKICGKWVHAGRVNTPGRLEYFEELGADSLDGTGLSRYSWMRDRIYRSAINPTLFTEEQHA